MIKDHDKGSKPRTSASSEKAPSAPTAVVSASTPTPSGDDAQEWVNRRASAQATRAANARQVSGRRRFVDPTTCEREYSRAEIEFMQAMHAYKLKSGRMFPTWSEVLEVLQSLGYQKPGHAATTASAAPAGSATAQAKPARQAVVSSER
jgi:hypothetical protein